MRRRYLLRITFVAVLICGASVAIARMAGAPKARTGAPAVGTRVKESDCTTCHDASNGPNHPGGLLEILDLPEKFDLNTDYPIRVRLAQAWTPLPPDPLQWGFQLTAVRADSGSGYGTFTPGPGTQMATQAINFPTPPDPTRTWIGHNSSGLRTGQTGPVEWNFTWRSPGYAAAKVYFFAAGNAADGAGTTSDDFIHTTSDSMTFVNVGVGQFAHGGTQLAPPSPNPARDRATLRYTLGRSGVIDLAVFDLSGRRVRTLVHGAREAGSGSATWDGRDATGRKVSGGIYFAKLRAPGEPAARVQKITLSR